MSKTVLFASNRSFGLYSSRRELMRSFYDSGWHVVICCNDASSCKQFSDSGYELIDVPFDRGGISVVSDLLSVMRLLWVVLQCGPTLIHAFNAKPIIFSGLVARLCRTPVFYSTITGLGNAFIKGGLVKAISILGYRAVFSNPKAKVIFQNSDDRAYFISSLGLSYSRTKLVLGSGVDLNCYSSGTFETDTPKVVLMISRLIVQKGIHEFVEVARRLSNVYPDVKFKIVGETEDGHPDSVSLESLSNEIESGIIEYCGYCTDIASELRSTYLLLHPSYQEGMPRVVMEASASGVPSIGFDVSGVRECIDQGVNGVIVPFGDLNAMTEAVGGFLCNPELRAKFSKSARDKAEKCFDRRSVTKAYINFYCEASEITEIEYSE